MKNQWMKNDNKKTIPIFLAFFVMGFGDVVGTLVGFARETFRLSTAMAGLLPFIGFVAFGLLAVPCGVLQDRKGKKFILLLGLSVALAGLIIPMLALSHYTFLIITILLLGSGMAILQVAGNPIMRDVSAAGRYSRNLSFAQFVKSIGSLSGAFLTTLVLSHWTGLFPIYSAIVAMAIIGVLLLDVPASSPGKGESRASIKSCFSLMKRPYVAVMLSGLFLYVGAEVGINSWIATYLNRTFQLDIKSLATLGIGFFFFALMVGRLAGSVILNWLSAKVFFLFTSVLSCLGILGLFLGSKSLALVAIFLIGLGFANIFPLVFSILIDQMPDKSNELSGLMVMAIVGGAIMPLVMGVIAERSIKASFLVPFASLVYITLTAMISLRPTANGNR